MEKILELNKYWYVFARGVLNGKIQLGELLAVIDRVELEFVNTCTFQTQKEKLKC